MKYLFNDWDKVSLEIQKSPRAFLFFDYDGTLTPIVSRPQEAKFPPGLKALIKRLHKNSKFKIAIISGRSLKDVEKMVAIRGITYIGNHGMEIKEPSSKILIKPGIISTRPLLAKVRRSLQKELGHIKGLRVEDKTFTLSVHFRLVKPEDRILIKRVFSRIVRPYVSSKKLRVLSGKMVLEARPGIEWDKGRAVIYLVRKHKIALPVYVGDDVTDQDAFRAIKGRGISIFVGASRRKESPADYFLKNPEDVGKFIERLLNLT